MLKALRFFFRLTTAFLAKYYLPLSIGAILGITSFVFSPLLLPFLPKFRPTRNIAIVGRFNQADIPLDIQRLISLGLTTTTTDGLPAPALAESWSIQDAGKTYIFTLSPNYKWQDSTSIKSHDIKYQFRDTTIEFPDNQHLTIKLKEPFSPLPIVLSRPVFKTGLLGAGQYRVSSIRKNGELVESLLLSPLDSNSQLPKLKYYFYATEQQARTAIKLGIVHILEDIQDPADLKNWPNIQATPQVHLDRYVGVFFNTQDSHFSNKNLRQALAYAINKSRWPDRTYGPIHPTSWAYNPNLKKYDYDAARAKQLLKNAGNLPPKITISTLPAYLPIAEDIKKDWQTLGLKVDVSSISEISSDFQVLLIAQAVPQDPDQYNLWHSTQSSNLTKFRSQRIDKLLEDGRKTTDAKERKTIYQDFQRFLVEETPAIFLFHPTTYILTRN